LSKKWKPPQPTVQDFNSHSNQKTVITVSQTETIYLMKATGEIKPYFKVTKSDDGSRSLFGGNDTKTKNKMIDRDPLEEFIPASDYEKLRQYALVNNLSFKKKEEFLKILTYYDQILEN
jgi:meiotically up-regulated gene 157 (Mug157) protein